MVVTTFNFNHRLERSLRILNTTLKSIQTAEGFRYIGWMSALVIAKSILVHSIAELFFPPKDFILKIDIWWFIVIVGPILETLLFTTFGCWVLGLFGVPPSLIIFITAAVFGWNHLGSDDQWVRALSTGITGCIFSWMYLRRVKEDRPWEGFKEVTLVHMIINGLVYIGMTFFAP